jgi:hypothetical protein
MKMAFSRPGFDWWRPKYKDSFPDAFAKVIEKIIVS